MSKKVNIRIYKTIIKPFVVYDSETWTLSERASNILATWEMKIHNEIYGPVCDRGIWRIRTNEELDNLYQSVDRVTDVKPRRLEYWAI
jgi:hypothetical protein